MSARRWSHHRRSAGSAASRPGLAERARRGEAGSVLVMVAASLTVIITCTALTVDLGRVSTLRRDLQNVADAAAFDLVRQVDGRSAGDITSDPRWTATRDASFERNDFFVGGARVARVRLGWYDRSRELFTPVAGAADTPTAVEVEVDDAVDHHFAPGSTTTSRKAVASQSASAGFQIGSFAARLDSSTSPLLDPLIGDALGVTAVGYSGLAGARVRLPLLATHLGLDVGSPTDLLDTDLTLIQLLTAQAGALRDDGFLAQAALIESIILSLPMPDTPIRLGDLLAIASGGAEAVAIASIDALDLLAATAFVANGTNAINVPGLNLGVPGVLSTGVQLQVIETPRYAFGGPGTSASTAQVRLTTGVDLSAVGLVGVRLNLTVEAASATGTIGSIGCGSPQGLDIDVDTGLVSVGLGLSGRIQVGLPPLLPSQPVATVTAAANTQHAGTLTPVHFDLPPDTVGTIRSASDPGIDITSLGLNTTWTFLPGLPLVGSLLNTLVSPLVEAVVDNTLGPLVDATVVALNNVLVRPLLRLLGITAPGADVSPLGISCSAARLVG